MEVHPTYLPSVPRIFEKLFTLAQGQLSAEEIEQIRDVGGQVRDLEAQRRGGAGRAARGLRRRSPPRRSSCARLFGGRLREAVTGAAPIAQEILEFFWGCGVPVLEGYGMTETSTAATYSTTEDHRFGTVGRALPGVEIKIAEDGEILLKGANIFGGYYKNADASFGAVEDGWLHTGDLGAARRGRLPVDHRPQEGHHHHRGRQEPHAGELRERPQADALGLPGVMHGDRRPFPVVLVTLDEEEIVPWAPSTGIEDTSIPALAKDPEVTRADPGARSTARTRSTRRSSRSRSSSSSTTTSRRRPAS